MQENINLNKPQILTVKQFADKNPWPGQSTLRTLFARRKTNGLERAFIKVGKRLLVDEEEFFRALKANRAKAKGEC